METSELIKKVRKIEIKTRGLSHNIFAGQYHSAFKGRGMSFSEVREYQYGDDVRDIDWNVTARFHKPFVKVYEEERELTVMLLVDVSESLSFGTIKQTKRNGRGAFQRAQIRESGKLSNDLRQRTGKGSGRNARAYDGRALREVQSHQSGYNIFHINDTSCYVFDKFLAMADKNHRSIKFKNRLLQSINRLNI